MELMQKFMTRTTSKQTLFKQRCRVSSNQCSIFRLEQGSRVSTNAIASFNFLPRHQRLNGISNYSIPFNVSPIKHCRSKHMDATNPLNRCNFCQRLMALSMQRCIVLHMVNKKGWTIHWWSDRIFVHCLAIDTIIRCSIDQRGKPEVLKSILVPRDGRRRSYQRLGP